MSGWRKRQIADLIAASEIHAGGGGYEIGSIKEQAAFDAARSHKKYLIGRLTVDGKVYNLIRAATKQEAIDKALLKGGVLERAVEIL